MAAKKVEHLKYDQKRLILFRTNNIQMSKFLCNSILRLNRLVARYVARISISDKLDIQLNPQNFDDMFMMFQTAFDY